MTKQELARERKARKRWKREAKKLRREVKALRASQSRVMLRWSATPGNHTHTIRVSPTTPYTLVPSVFNSPMPQPTAGPAWPALGDVICGAK